MLLLLAGRYSLCLGSSLWGFGCDCVSCLDSDFPCLTLTFWLGITIGKHRRTQLLRKKWEVCIYRISVAWGRVFVSFLRKSISGWINAYNRFRNVSPWEICKKVFYKSKDHEETLETLLRDSSINFLIKNQRFPDTIPFSYNLISCKYFVPYIFLVFYIYSLMSGVPLKAITTLQLNGYTTLRIHLLLPLSREKFEDVVRLVSII